MRRQRFDWARRWVALASAIVALVSAGCQPFAAPSLRSAGLLRDVSFQPDVEPDTPPSDTSPTMPEENGEEHEEHVANSTLATGMGVCQVMGGPLKAVLRCRPRMGWRLAAGIRHGRAWRGEARPEPALEPPPARFHPVPTRPVFAPPQEHQFLSPLPPLEPLPLPSGAVPLDESESPRKWPEGEDAGPPPPPEEVLPRATGTRAKGTQRDLPPPTKQSSFHNWRLARMPPQNVGD